MDETNTIASNRRSPQPELRSIDGTSFATNHAVIGSTQFAVGSGLRAFTPSKTSPE
jgi:hypothetical protein